MLEIKKLISEYVSFLKSNIYLKEIESGYEITTPFLDDKNDCIQIYVEEIIDGKILLSDGGEIVSNLEDYGVKLTPQRLNMIAVIVRGFGVSLSDDHQLKITTTQANFPKAKHSLLQAMLKVEDMSFTAQSKTMSLFSESVEKFLRENKIVCVDNISIIGKAGFAHNYDFIVPPTESAGERFIKAINKPTRSSVIETIFGWNETKEQRKGETKLITFLNDDNKFSSSIMESLLSYDIATFKKSDLLKNKENVIKSLTA